MITSPLPFPQCTKYGRNDSSVLFSLVSQTNKAMFGIFLLIILIANSFKFKFRLARRIATKATSTVAVFLWWFTFWRLAVTHDCDWVIDVSGRRDLETCVNLYQVLLRKKKRLHIRIFTGCRSDPRFQGGKNPKTLINVRLLCDQNVNISFQCFNTCVLFCFVHFSFHVPSLTPTDASIKHKRFSSHFSLR